MKPLFKRIPRIVSYCIPRGSLGKFVRFPLLTPFYHIVSDEEVPHIKHLFGFRTIDEFQKDMEFFLKYYRPLALDELLVHAKNGRPLAENCFFLSFDDGLRENHDIIAPILKKMGIPATFFVTTAALDNADMLYRHKASLLVNYLLSLQQKNISQIRSVLARHGIHTCDSDLAQLVLSGDFCRGEVIPIPKHRALAQIRNPRVGPEDVPKPNSLTTKSGGKPDKGL